MFRRLLKILFPLRSKPVYKIVVKVDNKPPTTTKTQYKFDIAAIEAAIVQIQNQITNDTHSITAKVWRGNVCIWYAKGELDENKELDLDTRHFEVCGPL